jgi:Flp pilus assembly protein TadD
MDLDGPRSDKGMYAIVPVGPRMTIRNEDVITWSSFQGDGGGQARIGFMSQVSPDGRHVVTTLSGPEALRQTSRGQPRNAPQSNFYVANFKDYRFLQVFYPTRGILAWYDRQTGRLRALPGADDPRYVQASAVWSADGKYLVFARAEAREPYPENSQLVESANDARETQIRYDLYRVPFNNGKGGRAERIVGASENGLSNSFPKISPDGRWIVFVQSRNGQLMRPDSQLYIVPAEGGEARRMRCNTRLMNSWHSFSPNGRWLVFSSKSRSPYTQMFLTHIDQQGNDSPPILIDNATAANRAVNIPEFVNIPSEQTMHIDVPAAEFYRLFDVAWELGDKGQGEAAVAAWRKALELSPGDARAHYNLGVALAGAGRLEDAITHYRKALAAQPEFGEVHNNLAVALAATGKLDEAIAHYSQALEFYPNAAGIRTNFGVALIWRGRPEEGIAQFKKALDLNPGFVEARRNLGDALYYFRGRLGGALAEWRTVLQANPNDIAVLNEAAWVLATCPDDTVRNGTEAARLAERAARLAGDREPAVLTTLAAAYAEVGRFREAAETARRAMLLAQRQGNRPLAETIKARRALYDANTPVREKRPPSPIPAIKR